MNKEKLWTKNFIALTGANGFLFTGFHCLLPTLPVYAASLGATGSQIGIVTGIFGFAAIFVRLFTDTGVRSLGKKKCLYIGLLLSFIATVSYRLFSSIDILILARIIHGFGFGLSTTFAAAIVSDVIPDSRRGEGIGYFGLGSTIAMALAPALGVMLLDNYSSISLFAFSAAATCFAILCTKTSNAKEVIPQLPTKALNNSIKNKLFEHGTGVPAILTILFGVAYGSVNTFIIMMANEAGIADAGLFFILGTVFVFISRPFGGRLFDLKGAFWVVLPGAVCFLLSLFILINSVSLPMLLGASVLYGLGGGLLLPALMTWTLNLVRSDRRSAASATFYNMLDIGTSAGIILLGSVAGSIGYISMYNYVIYTMIAFIVFFLLQHFFNSRSKSFAADKNES